MNFWKTIREFINLVIDGMCKRNFNEVELGKNFFQLRADEFIETVIIGNVKKAATDHVIAEVLRFLCGEYNIAMTRHMNERVIINISAARFHYRLLRIDIGVNIFIAELDEIRKRSFKIG